MLNKVKKNILPMLNTLGDALTQHLALPTDELLNGIFMFIDAINTPISDEYKDVVVLSEQLKASLKNPVLAEVERLYNKYCTAIENLPVQYKVVFLPYYDNTWNSLASVYEAFSANPLFVTEIVIIPIRRNTPTGWSMVYEDYLTPRGIPNTPFSSYNFENDLPDFVFYNNPYDGVNIEKFQSHKIKPYVGCMIYIPYFLYRHIFLDKENMEKQTNQFTQLSGHDNSDVFIVQGKSFLKAFSHRSRNGKKMIALGSPKTDNICKYMQNYPRYPEWDNATKGKTVFLLNTHYSAAISGGYKGFLSYFFEFAEQNDDFALIWRPHPQSFLMFDEQSEAYSEWQSCLKRVANHKQMLIDCTNDSASAIMYSDAIISQNSSIVAESIFADKPIFLLARNPMEEVPPEIWGNMTIEDYMTKLKKIRQYDKKNLFLFSCVCHFGLFHDILKEEYTKEYRGIFLVREFMNDIMNGIDSKKELRKIFREQLFVNGDGTCGQKIHDYIVGLIDNA